jgi:hypothetical protein
MIAAHGELAQTARLLAARVVESKDYSLEIVQYWTATCFNLTDN